MALSKTEWETEGSIIGSTPTKNEEGEKYINFINPKEDCIFRRINLKQYDSGNYRVAAYFSGTEFSYPDSFPDRRRERPLSFELTEEIGAESKKIGRLNFCGIYISSNSHDAEGPLKLINFIKKYEDIDEISYRKMLEQLQLRLPEKEVIDEIEALLEENEIDSAIEKAILYQEQGYFSPLWNIAKSLNNPELIADEVISISKLVTLFETISSKSPYFREAGDQLYALYGAAGNKPKQLDAAFQSGHGKLMLMTFLEQSGIKLGDRAIEGESLLEPETMRKLAGYIKGINEENKKLQEENKQLQKEIEEIKPTRGRSFGFP